MASLNPLRDISETFCQCSICLEQFKEPKLLPCLHRFCRDCLNSIIQQSPENHCCPECRKEFSVSEEGADGLKSDFSMKSLIEFIQLQTSLLDVQVADCFGCSRKVSVTAYCFECEDFLCEKCQEYHLISKSLRNHQQHVVDLNEAKSRNFTFEKLVSLKGASRCQIHSGNVSELCCVTCHKRPICVACTYGEHKEHDIIDVKTLATGERKKLDVELVKVTNAKEAIYKMPPLLDGMKKEIESNIKKRKDILHASCDTEISIVNEKMKRLTKEHKEKYQNIKRKREEAIVELEQEMEKEIKKIKDRYQQLMKDTEVDHEGKQIDLQNIYDEKLAKLKKTLNTAQKDLKDLVSSIEKEQKERLQKINVIICHFENAIKRYENFQSMASSIVTSSSDWTVVECVPAICSAAEPLLKEMGTTFPELDALDKVDISNIPTAYVGEDNKGSMTLSEKQLTVFKTNKPDEWLTYDMTTANGIVVISGYASQAKQLNITAIEITDESTFKCNTKNLPKWSWRYGETLSESEIAAASLPHTIGVYDLNDESHSTRNISDITKSWPNGRLITSVATDEGKDHILVGGYSSGDIFVFNKQLDYFHTLTLPKWIYWPRDLIVNDDKLYICDFTGQKVSAFTIEGSEAKFLCEFMKPDLDEDLDEDCVTPLNMCKDKNGFIYILWKSGTSLQNGKRVIVRYTKVGRQLLTMEDVDDNAACIETVETEGGELLLVMTLTSGILYTYHLERERG